VREPFIVPPTWDKAEHYDALRPVWREAARHLREAENIIVVGFSLPETDQFFRYLYAIGSIGQSRPKRFWVFDTVPSEWLNLRYRSLLGPLTEPGYALVKASFAHVAGHLGQHGTYEDGLRNLQYLVEKNLWSDESVEWQRA